MEGEVIHRNEEKGYFNAGNTSGSVTKSNAISIPQISLPKGGGALKGIDEKFSVNPSNGTASFSIPLPITAGRNGFQPELALSYNSGAGNSPFGLGWNIEYPAIHRKTDKRLPRYGIREEEDLFILSGAEDLVPALKKVHDKWVLDIDKTEHFTITRYRPRVEGLFARIEKVEPIGKNVFYWKITTKDNIVTFYGRSITHRVSDPADASRIFKWLPEIGFDDKGNCILYEYKEENLENVENAVHEKNRFSGLAGFTNKYLKRILYGNVQPYNPGYNLPQNIYNCPAPDGTEFLFQVVFDYGEHSDNQPLETGTWKSRIDAFSDYRAGFELRTYRLCKRILLFHHFTNREFELEDNDIRIPYLVRSLDLEHESSSAHSVLPSELTYLVKVKHTGYKKSGSSYTSKSLPPIEFDYERLNWHTEVRAVAREDSVHAPAGITGNYQWIDLFGEGIPGILTESAEAWYYKSNLGNGFFSRAKTIAPKPSYTGLSTGILQMQDLDADGQRQVVVKDAGLQGYFGLNDDNEWKPLRHFERILNIDHRDPNVRFLDLNGDGMPELLITEENDLTWYPSNGSCGYLAAERTLKSFDEEKGPAIVFADSAESIYLADMNGDGLTDIVRIRNAEICYWPNCGYGRFGARVVMSNAPLFDIQDHFNPTYLHLADVSGTGVTDILYLGKSYFKAWLNLSGNAWSEPCTIEPFMPLASPNQLSVVDFLGNGTSCILWSSPLPEHAGMPMRYIDLMGGKKPHILTLYKNNLGKEVILEYKSSTHYYLEDMVRGKPWITKLPFPVHCLSRVETIDKVANLRFANSYTYHHGYYDHNEREFRGFGRVEQIDTEEYEYLKNEQSSNATDIQYHEPPLLTRTWFHTGAFFRNEKILNHFENEYWYHDPGISEQYGVTLEYLLPPAIIENEQDPDELIEAHRACKGMVLRQEIFSLDGSGQEKFPYSVATHNCIIKKLQPKDHNKHAVFIVQESEAIIYAYERNIADPRVSHTLNLEIDELGNVLKNAAVVYPRKYRPVDLTDERIWNEQNKQSIILTETGYTLDHIETSSFRLRLPWQVKTYELRGIEPGNPGGYFQMQDLATNASEIGYEKEFTLGSIEKRLVEHLKTLYLSDQLVTPLPEGYHDSLGFVHESYHLAFTPSLLDLLYQQNATSLRVNEDMLAKGQYVQMDQNWWIRSGTIQYKKQGETIEQAAQRFYVPLSYMDPFGSTTTVGYYPGYFLLLQQIKDEMENTSSVERYDFRILTPARIKDMNANHTEVVYDILGLVAGVALEGKGNEADDLVDFIADPSTEQVDAFFNAGSEDVQSIAKELLQHATSRQVYDFSRIPCVVATILREEHFNQNLNSKLQYSFEYTDGLGNIVLKKIQAEEGDAPHRDENGKLIKNEDGSLHLQWTVHRWVGNGRTILNNKGNPVKQYEPYFSDTHAYEAEAEMRETGISPVLHYDAAGRMVRTDLPDGTFAKVEYDSWQQKSFDASDNVLDSIWYAKRMNPSAEDLETFAREGKDSVKEKSAAGKSAVHSNTPATIHLDALGRPFLSITHNKRKDPGTNVIVEEFSSTFSILDIEGNLLAVIDAVGNIVMQYGYDMLGRQVYQNSMDAGERWLLNDSMGKSTYTWDSKDNQFEVIYDTIHRPVSVALTRSNSTKVVDKMQYCDTKSLNADSLARQQQLNLIGKLEVQFDNAGIVRLTRSDFKGNTLETSRQYCRNFKETPDWQETSYVEMEEDVFFTKNEFDALSRPTRIHTPHKNDLMGSVVYPQYSEANLLNAVSVQIQGSEAPIPFITNIDYDAKGQRQAIHYGNGTKTRYDYDDKTFRLSRLFTTGNNGAKVFQDLRYTYDASGNITHIFDHAFEPIFFNNQRIDAVSEYDYDALYQLIRATGREHSTQNRINESATYNGNGSQFRNFPFEVNSSDSQAVRGYTENYLYDTVGNILQMQHVAGLGSWTRVYWYNNNDKHRDELVVGRGNKKNNQLLQTKTGTDAPVRYTHDIHGNMLQMAHLQDITWNYNDQLQLVDLGGGGKAYYVYDNTGQRIRKVIERNSGIKEERLYLGAVEVYRETDRSGNVTKQTDTLHIMDDTKRIAMVDTPVITSVPGEEQVVRYIYSNHLGSSSLELTSDATDLQMISYEEYHPFGTTAYSLQNSAIKVAAKRYRYTGMERDEETGLNYHHARYYANWLGRWVSADPIGTKDGLNVFSYCKNNTINKADLDGKTSLVVENKTSHRSEIIYNNLEVQNQGLYALYSGGANYSTASTIVVPRPKPGIQKKRHTETPRISNPDTPPVEDSAAHLRAKNMSWTDPAVLSSPPALTLKLLSDIAEDDTPAFGGDVVGIRFAAGFFVSSFEAPLLGAHASGEEAARANIATESGDVAAMIEHLENSKHLAFGAFVSAWLPIQGIGRFVSPTQNTATKIAGNSTASKTMSPLQQARAQGPSTAKTYHFNAGWGPDPKPSLTAQATTYGGRVSQYAKDRGLGITISDTPAGAFASNLPNAGPQIWRPLSADYATEAALSRADVHVTIGGFNYSKSVWASIERPILRFYNVNYKVHLLVLQ